MTDDLTVQVREALTESLPEDMFGSLASALAPRIAAALRAVARDAIERTASDLCSEDLGGWVKQNSPFALAAGLAALRGTEEPHE